jgi:hypothetical protein
MRGSGYLGGVRSAFRPRRCLHGSVVGPSRRHLRTAQPIHGCCWVDAVENVALSTLGQRVAGRRTRREHRRPLPGVADKLREETLDCGDVVLTVTVFVVLPVALVYIAPGARARQWRAATVSTSSRERGL